MNPQELRDWVEKRLGGQHIPDPIWEHLEDLRHHALDDDEEREALITELRGQLRLYRELKHWEWQTHGYTDIPSAIRLPPQPTRLSSWSPTQSELDTLYTISLALASRAASEPRVQDLRRQLFGNRLVLSERVESLCSSPFWRFATPEQVAAWDIPIAEHVGELAFYELVENGKKTQVDLNLITDYDSLQSFVWWTEHENAVHVAGCWMVEPTEAFHTCERAGDGHLISVPIKAEREVQWIPDSAENGPSGPALTHMTTKYVPIWPDSVLDYIARVARWLSKSYPWSEAQAIRFLLTGDVPVISLISGKVGIWNTDSHGLATISVTAPAWLSPESVAQFYRYLRRSYYLSHLRRREPRAVRLVQFVARAELRAHLLGQKRPKLDDLRREWNELHPDWAYSNIRAFSRDYGRAMRGFLDPTSRTAPRRLMPLMLPYNEFPITTMGGIVPPDWLDRVTG